MAAFASDNFTQTAGTNLVGATATDGTVYAARQGTSVKVGLANDVYSSAAGWNEVLSGTTPAHSDYDIALSVISPASGASTSQPTFLLHCDSEGGSASATFRLRFIDVGTTLYSAFLEELTGFNNLSTTTSIGGGQTFARNSTTNYILSVRGRVLTLALAATPTTIIATVTATFALKAGKVGLGGYNGGSNSDTAGLHWGPWSATLYTGTPTAYTLIAPVSIWDIAAAGSAAENTAIAAGFPTSFNIAGGSFTCAGGYGDTGYWWNGRFKISLNGGVLGSDFLWTPATGTATGASVVAGAVKIPAGQTYAFFDWYCPPATAAGAYSLTGTNNAGFSNPTLALTVKANLAIIEGDSNSNPAYLADYVQQLVIQLGSTWKIFSSAVAGSTLAEVATRIATAATPWYSSSRVGKQEFFLFVGTNDVNGGASAATIQANFASVVASLKGGGWTNHINICPIVSRNATVAGGAATFWAIAAAVNTWQGTTYGPYGTDRTVMVVPWANDTRICAQTAYTSTTYWNADGIHLVATAGTALVSGYAASALTYGNPASTGGVSLIGGGLVR